MLALPLLEVAPAGGCPTTPCQHPAIEFDPQVNSVCVCVCVCLCRYQKPTPFRDVIPPRVCPWGAAAGQLPGGQGFGQCCERASSEYDKRVGLRGGACVTSFDFPGRASGMGPAVGPAGLLLLDSPGKMCEKEQPVIIRHPRIPLKKERGKVESLLYSGQERCVHVNDHCIVLYIAKLEGVAQAMISRTWLSTALHHMFTVMYSTLLYCLRGHEVDASGGQRGHDIAHLALYRVHIHVDQTIGVPCPEHEVVLYCTVVYSTLMVP